MGGKVLAWAASAQTEHLSLTFTKAHRGWRGPEAKGEQKGPWQEFGAEKAEAQPDCPSLALSKHSLTFLQARRGDELAEDTARGNGSPWLILEPPIDSGAG